MRKTSMGMYLQKSLFALASMAFVVLVILNLVSHYFVYKSLITQERNELADMFVQLIQGPWSQGSELEVRARMRSVRERGHVVCSSIVTNEIISDCEQATARLQVLKRQLYFDSEKQSPAGTVTLYFSSEEVWKTAWPSMALAGLFIVFLTGVGFLLARKFLRKIEVELKIIQRTLEDDAGVVEGGEFVISEFEALNGEIRSSISARKELAESEGRNQLARQVAHDIRSPLTVLEILLTDTSGRIDAQRDTLKLVARRINDIAHQLLDVKNKSSQPKLGLVLERCEEIVSEKRTQWGSRFSVEFEATKIGAFSFSNLLSVEFGRVLSNLMDNAADASEIGSVIRVTLDRTTAGVQIKVIDIGRGIAAETLEKIMTEGGSWFKEDGHGIGLQTVKEFAFTMHGSFTMTSRLGSGTEAVLTLPLVMPPVWFLGEQLIVLKGKVVVVDDDESMRELWKTKLAFAGIAVEAFPDFDHALVEEGVLLICDYEISHKSYNGLEEALRLGWKRILLSTSYHENEEIQQRVVAAGHRILPKILLPYLNIERKGQWVLVDDDALTRASWKAHAKLYGIQLSTYSSGEEFRVVETLLDKKTRIYLDVNLGAEDGLQLARALIDRGFSDIWLCTGHAREELPHIVGVNGVVGKRFPG